MSSISSVSSSMQQQLDPSRFFKKADADSSGGISKDELSSMLKDGPAGAAGETQDIDAIFDAVDTDGDGVISEAENQAHMEEMAENGPGAPMEMSGSTEAFDSFVEALKSSELSDEDLTTLLQQWAADLKEKGSSTTLFSSEA